MASQAIIDLKAQQVDEIKSKIQSAKGIVVINYSGLNVAEDTAFRKDLREAGVEYSVLKNRLVKRAFNELGYTQFDEALNGPTAIAFDSTDPVAPAKHIKDSIEKMNKLQIKCGMVDGSFIDEAGVKELASLPSKEIILAKLLGTMQAPITKLAGTLSQIVGGLAIALSKVAEQKQ